MSAPSSEDFWTQPLGRVGHDNPDALYKPSPERIAELRAMPYHDYLETLEWKERRRITLLEQGHRCQLCGRHWTLLDVHHLTYERVGKELPEDLQVLCRRCHTEVHGL